MKWINLKKFGCELYIHGQDIKSRVNETNIPDFRIKVIDNALYKESLLKGSGSLSLADSPYYEQTDTPNLYRRISKQNISPKEFLNIFGKENITPDILTESSLEDIVFEGHIINLNEYNVNFKEIQFKGEKRPSILIYIKGNDIYDAIPASSLIDVIRKSYSQTDLTNSIEYVVNKDLNRSSHPAPYSKDWFSSPLKTEEGNDLGGYIYFKNAKKDTVKQLSADLETAMQEEDENKSLQYNHFKSSKGISDNQTFEEVLGETDERIKKSWNTELNQTSDVIEETFNLFFEREEFKYLKPKIDGLKVYALKENNQSLGTLKNLQESHEEDFNNFIKILNTNEINQLNSKSNHYYVRNTSRQFLNTDELRIAFDDKEQLIEYFNLDNDDDIVEIDQNNDLNRLVCVNDNGVMVFNSTDNVIERIKYSTYDRTNTFKMKVVFDEFKVLNQKLSQVVNLSLATLDENNQDIEKVFDDIMDKINNIKKLRDFIDNETDDVLDNDFNVKDHYIELFKEYDSSVSFFIDKYLLSDIVKLKKLRDTYIENFEKQKIEDERKEIDMRLKQEREDTLDALKEYIDTNTQDTDTTNAKERIEDYGEKIGGAVKDDYRYLSKNLNSLSNDEYMSLLSNIDSTDLDKLATKAVVLKLYDPIELKEEGVDPTIAYAIKLLTRALPTSAKAAGVPPALYIHAVKKMYEIMYDNRHNESLNDFIDTTTEELDKNFFFNDVIKNNKIYRLRKNYSIDSKIFTNMLYFNSTEEVLNEVEKERDQKNILSKYDLEVIKQQNNKDDPLDKKERAIANLAYLTFDFDEEFKIVRTACLGKVVDNIYSKPYNFSSKVQNDTSYVNKWYKMITLKMIEKYEKKMAKQNNETIENDIETDDEINIETDISDSNDLLEQLKKELKEGGINSKEIKHLGNVERHGEDYGINDIDEEVFSKTFDFRAVEFGNWLPQKERKIVLQYAFNSFMDLANALNLPVNAVSLDGTLAMAFGSRGRSSALAHFEPDRNVINLTRMKGAGSLAHEFGHALDKHIVNYLCEKYPGLNSLTKNGNFISEEIVKNAESKKYKVLLNNNKIEDIREVIKDDADKILFDNYIDLTKSFFFRKNSKELSSERQLTEVMLSNKFAPRAIKNMANSIEHFIHRDVLTDKNDYDAYLKKHGTIMHTRYFDNYVQNIASVNIFDLHTFSEKLKNAFDKAESVLYDLTREEIFNIGVKSTPELEEIKTILFEHLDKSVKNLTKFVNRFTPAPDTFEIPEIKEDVIISTNFTKYINDSFAYSFEAKDPWLKYLYNDSDDRNNYVYDGLFDYLWKISTNKINDYVDRARLRKNYLVDHGSELKKLKQTPIKGVVETQYYNNAETLDKTTYYYREPIELFARSFESYVFDKLEQRGQRNDYLVSSCKAPELQDKYSSRYPLEYEREVIDEKIENLVESYRQALFLNSKNEQGLDN